MLTAAQVATVAFVTEYGEFICRDDAHDLFDQGDGDGLRPVSQYEMDEYDAENSSEWFRHGDDDLDHAEYCSCTLGVLCEECGNPITEAWTDPDCEVDDEAE